MKNFTLPTILIIVIGMMACNRSENANQYQGEENKALVDKFSKASLNGDLRTLADLMADNYIDYGPGMKDSTNKEQNVAFFKKMNEENNSVKYERLAATAFHLDEGKLKGDWVSEWGTLSLTPKNSSRAITFRWNGTYRVKDGKIDLHYTYYNLAEVLEQQGFKFVPPGEQKK